jgi:gamma-glutamyltranspeptidase/glutathione hydrolase
MYTGPWAEDFVRIVRREGGQVTADDLKRYEPVWSEPCKETVFGHTVYVNGPPHLGVQSLFTGLNLAEALQLDRQGPYWSDPATFQALARIEPVATVAPSIGRRTMDLLRANGVDISPDAQLGKAYARALAPLLARIFTPPAGNDPKHSNAIVVVDRDGNIATITHTINSVIWGDTGIVVDGIPIPDSASFQQAALAAIKPGDRVPHRIIDTIAFEGDKPVLATGSIGSSLVPESIRVLVCVLGQHQDLAMVMRAPPLLSNVGMSVIERPAWQLPVPFPSDGYSPDFREKLKPLGLVLSDVPSAVVSSLRGTLAAVSIDPKTGRRTAVDQPGIYVFNAAE